MTPVPAGDVLFRRLVGAEAFDALPAPVRALHRPPGQARWRGEVHVQRGAGGLARLCAWATRLPAAGSGPIGVEIAARGDREVWTRRFPGRAMTSRLHASEGLLVERLGHVAFRFRLQGSSGGITWTLAGARVLGVIPLPTAWCSGVRAREWGEGGRYRFEVRAALPWAGLVVAYRGWLQPVAS